MFDTFNDLQTFLSVELSKREREIDNILYRWLTNSRTSEMFYRTDRGFFINTVKAQNHFKLVSLYNILLKTNFIFRERRNPHDISLRSINPKTNENSLRDHNTFNEKKEKEKQHLDSTQQYADELLKELNLSYSIDEIKNDFTSSRTILKNAFKDIFPLYGIDMDAKVVNRIFGTVVFRKQNYDVVSLFTNNTSFAGSLQRQFSITQSGKANGLFSAFFMRSAGLLDTYGNDSNCEEFETIKYSSTHNPFFREKQALRILATIYVTCYSRTKYS